VQISPANTAYMYDWIWNVVLIEHLTFTNQRQQNSGAVEDFILPYAAAYLRIQRWKKLLQSVHICQSYPPTYNSLLFWPTLYMLTTVLRTTALYGDIWLFVQLFHQRQPAHQSHIQLTTHHLHTQVNKGDTIKCIHRTSVNANLHKHPPFISNRPTKC